MQTTSLLKRLRENVENHAKKIARQRKASLVIEFDAKAVAQDLFSFLEENCVKASERGQRCASFQLYENGMCYVTGSSAECASPAYEAFHSSLSADEEWEPQVLHEKITDQLDGALTALFENGISIMFNRWDNVTKHIAIRILW
jgi:hypothetical protein